jgi:hypothetical protein
MQRSMMVARFRASASVACAAIALGSGGVARGNELVAPSGITGAGTRPDCNGRAWAELGLSVRDEEAVAWTQLGLGVRPNRWLELEALLPVAHGIIERQETLVESGSGGGDGGTPLWLGNPYFGANLLLWGEPGVRSRIGAASRYPSRPSTRTAAVATWSGCRSSRQAGRSHTSGNLAAPPSSGARARRSARAMSSSRSTSPRS